MTGECCGSATGATSASLTGASLLSFPIPSSDAATASTSSAMARLMDADGADRLDVLVSVDQSGSCVLSAFGVFQVRAMLRIV